MTLRSAITCTLTTAALSLRLYAAQLTTAAPATPAQGNPAISPAKLDPLGRSSPHGCAAGFLRAAGRSDYALAAEYLDTQLPPPQAQELARKLKTVLDLASTANVEALPRTINGDLQRGLPATRQRVGSVKTKSGTLEVILDRFERGNNGSIWLFSSSTLLGVPQAFKDLGPSNPATFFPHSLAVEVLTLPLWRWISILLGVAVSLVGTFFLTRALMPLFGMLVRRLTGENDEHRLNLLKPPIAVIQLGVAVRLIGLLGVSLLAREIWKGTARTLAITGVAWLVVRFADIISLLSTRRLVRRRASDKIALVAFTRRLFKIVVVLLAAIFLLRQAGVNVTAMLAGLGIGGVALVLAAQKTLENFFGGVALIMREVVRVGDFCKIAEQLGTIEDVGFSATRVRTLDRTIVSVSNAQVAQTTIENYTMRDKFWFHHTFGLQYDTTAEQLRDVLGSVGDMLRTHPKVESDSARIRLIEFGRSSLDVETFAYVRVDDYVPFLDVQEELLLRIIALVGAAGTHLALPSQMTYLDRNSGEALLKLPALEPDSQARGATPQP